MEQPASVDGKSEDAVEKEEESRCEGNQQCEESREDVVEISGSQTTLCLSGSGNT